jgi:hypothetical protein
MTIFCHSGGGRNPGFSMASGCRIKSGMTVEGLFQDFDILISD